MTHALTLQLLEWISARPRTRAEVLEAWRTTCPRLTIWEDAWIDGLVEVGPDGNVGLTSEGRQFMDEARADARARAS